MNELKPAEMTTLVADVNRHHRELQTMLAKSLDIAKEAGEILARVKSSLPHGQFGKWLAENCEFSDRTARTYMTIAESWDSIASNRKRFRNLSVREAVKMVTDKPSSKATAKPDADAVDLLTAMTSIDPDDWGHMPEEWEPGLCETVIGKTPDGRIIVIRSEPDARFVRWFLHDQERGFCDYGKKPINRHFLSYCLSRLDLHPYAVEWFDRNSEESQSLAECIIGIALNEPED